MKTKYLTCACSAPNHTLRFMYDTIEFDKGDELPTIYAEIALSHYLPWYKRMWVAVKYIFGMDTPDHFGCWEINSIEDAETMIEILLHYRESHNKFEALMVKQAQKLADDV